MERHCHVGRRNHSVSPFSSNTSPDMAASRCNSKLTHFSYCLQNKMVVVMQTHSAQQIYRKIPSDRLPNERNNQIIRIESDKNA